MEWSVTGGEAPYSLTIDGESEDAVGRYAGTQGVASVSCALGFTDSFIHVVGDSRTRRYHSLPVVDSGRKTIRAVVTDANGASAEASLEVYVILSLSAREEPLQGGHTYRLHDVLLTVPDGHFVAIDNLEDHVGANDIFALIVLDGASGSIADDSTWIAFVLIQRTQEGPVERRRSVAEDRAGELNTMLDQLVGSFGQPPTATASARDDP